MMLMLPSIWEDLDLGSMDSLFLSRTAEDCGANEKELTYLTGEEKSIKAVASHIFCAGLNIQSCLVCHCQQFWPASGKRKLFQSQHYTI